MIPIRSQADLDRANIQVAWSFAWKMTPVDFEQLCQVTAAQLRRDLAADRNEAVYG